MRKHKAGEVVIRIGESYGAYGVTYGKQYIVAGDHPDDASCLKLEGIGGGWMHSSFKRIGIQPNGERILKEKG